MKTAEKTREVSSGWTALVLAILGLVAIGVCVYFAVMGLNIRPPTLARSVALLIVAAFALITWFICLNGFFTLQPNEAGVLILFGKYCGTVKSSGFKWANPFYQRIKISLRSRNLNMKTIKVNDLRGNPIEIGAVVVWRVEDTAMAVFDVERFEEYVTVQSEAALRHLAMAYPYDTFGEGEVLSLRGSTDEISKSLVNEIMGRVAKTGVVIEESRLSHLAYAPEIASNMLQRQQAEAIVAARSRLVEGAVGMVEMALERLETYGKIEMDAERKAAMVGNLLVVLCGHESAHPVVNAGTLYTG